MFKKGLLTSSHHSANVPFVIIISLLGEAQCWLWGWHCAIPRCQLSHYCGKPSLIFSFFLYFSFPLLITYIFTAPFLAVNSATIVVNHLAFKKHKCSIHKIQLCRYCAKPSHLNLESKTCQPYISPFFMTSSCRWSEASVLASGAQFTLMPLGRRIENWSENNGI